MIYLLVKLHDNTVLVGSAETDEGDELVLDEVRMVVYWDASTKGLVGLCSSGPGKGCRVSQPGGLTRIPKAQNVRFSVRMSVKAWAAFQESPWG